MDYLCAATNRYFTRQIAPIDVVHTYSGVRPLYDDGASEAKAVTRDYVLELDEHGPPLLSVFGGKITTARHLAEEALEKLGFDKPVSRNAPFPFEPVPTGGEDFGGGLTSAAIDHYRDREWARTAADVLWRRTKAGLHITPEQRAHVADYMGDGNGG